jgi:hypothetical protein
MKLTELVERSEWLSPLPEEFLTDYALGNYSDARIIQVMWKYLGRATNIRRAWARIWHHMPETMTADEPLDMLELSTAHGAMMEVWRSQGHRCVGTDFNWVGVTADGHSRPAERPWQANLLKRLRSVSHDNPVAEEVPGWVYQPIIESLGLDVRLHDGGIMPYPFEDKSFDVVCCYQAIEAYAPPEHWHDVAHEFCRIARRSVVIGFNPEPASRLTDTDYIAACNEAWLGFQKFAHGNMRTSYFEIGTTRRRSHPTVCKISVF